MNVRKLREFGEQYRNLLFWLVVVLLFSAVFLNGCKDGPTDPDEPKTERITKTIIPTDGSNTLSNATLYDDDSGDELGVGETDLTRDEGTTLSIRAEADGFHSATESVSFTSSSDVEIALEAENPEEVAIDFEIRDSETDSLVAGDIIANGDSTVAEDKVSGTIFLPYGETPIELCTQPTYFTETCESVTPDQDRTEILVVERESVDVTVNVIDQSGSAVDDPTIMVDDYTYADGETSHAFGARAGNRAVFVTASGFDSLETSISADESHNLEAEIADLPECSDGIDNDGVDGIDEEDPGCLDSNGNYDPDDDNETLRVATLTLGSTASDETYFISGAEGEREFLRSPGRNDLPVSIQHAVTITVEVEIKISASQTGEEFALEWHTGPDDNNLSTVNTTEISEDQGRDGWVYAEFQDIDKSFFVNGTSYEVLAIHATKVRGENPTDGNDDVVFLEAGDGTTRWFIIQWEYQPEDVE